MKRDGSLVARYAILPASLKYRLQGTSFRLHVTGFLEILAKDFNVLLTNFI